MIIFKFGLLLMLHIDLILTLGGVVYLKREKRKLESAHNIKATFDDFNELSSSDDKEKQVNPLSKFYDSQDSAVGSGESNGSGLEASGGNVEGSGLKISDEFVGSASGDVTGENDDMDASFAQLIGDENEDQRDIVSSGSGYNVQLFAESDEPVSDGSKGLKADQRVSDSAKGLNNITFAETGAILKMLAPKDDENQSQTSGLEKSKEKRDLRNDIGVEKRSLEKEKKMSLLQEFFNLMSSTDDVEKRNKELRKRNIDDVEGEFEEFREPRRIENKVEEPKGLREIELVDDKHVYRISRASEKGSDKEIRIRKRAAEDLGDETLPNLSYLEKEDRNSKIVKLGNEDNAVQLIKRNVLDGDNAVRFLEEVNTENMFTAKENEMLERITRGKGTDEDSLDSSVMTVDENSVKKQEKSSQFPMIRMSKRNMPRPSKGVDVPMATAERTETEDVPMATAERTETEETWADGTEAKIENVGWKDKREAEDFQLIMEKDLERKSSENWKDVLREKRQDISSVFEGNRKNRAQKRRDVIMDSDIDADEFMANIGKANTGKKEKRFLRNDESPFQNKLRRNHLNLISDTVSDLTPLNNEYLQNLDNMKDQINPIESKRDLTGGLQKESEKDRAAMNLDLPTKANEAEQKQGSLIGIHNKPTQVAGFWSGLGSKPIFVEKHSEEVASGSGLEEIMKLDPVSNSGSLGRNKFSKGRKNRVKQRKFKPEDVGDIMDDKESRLKKERSIRKGKGRKKAKSQREKREKIRKKRTDKEDGKTIEIDKESMNNEGTGKGKKTSQAVLAFDELHEIVAKNEKKNEIDDMDKENNKEKSKNGKKRMRDKESNRSEKGGYDDDNDDDDTSGDDEESGDEETRKEIRSYPEDEVVVKTLSATYRQNDVIDKRSRIIVKRAPYNGYIGCYVDVLHPIRDLAVRAGIPFVTISNCRSVCKRTGYYYAGLQFGYLCFCGNSYGKYDMAPDSECNYACSGDGNQTCGGLWRNSVYFTAGAPDHSNEGPVPFYLPPTDKGALAQINESNIKRSEIPQSPSHNHTYAANTTYFYPPTQNTTSQLTQATQATQTTQPQSIQTTQPQAAQYATSNYNATSNDVVKMQSNTITNEAVTTSEMPRNQSENPGKENTGVKIVNGKRKVLMHFAYLHPQEHQEIQPTKPPAPTPPLRIEPQTRVFKGEIKLKQKWFDEFKDKMSTKSLILAGNVEQALKNIYGNSSNKNDFLKAEVLSFREGLINNNPYTVTKTIVEFTLTFDQNAISPDAKLFSKVRATKRLDEMPVYPKSLKVSEYRFDPNSPHQAFKVPIKAPADALTNNGNDDEESRKSTIAQPNNQSPITENVIASSAFHQQSNQLNTVSENMKELQDYLVSEKSLPPSANVAVNLRDANRAKFATNVRGIATARSNIVQENAGYSKRSNIQPSIPKGEKVPYILRLFFWKDMLARRKRFSSNEKLSTALTRGRRGEVDDFESGTVPIKTDDKLKNNKMRMKKLENKQIPLTQNKLMESRFMKKIKRRTKDLTTEKELKRSKRLDEFEDFD